MLFFGFEINKISKLQKETGKEWGFLIVWDYKNKEMRASEYIKGKEKGVWHAIDSKEIKDAAKLNDSEVVLGFFHSHPDDNKDENQFSGDPGDLRNFFVLYDGFSGLPTPEDKSILFMGVVTPNQIQVLKVDNVDNFNIIKDNYWNLDQNIRVQTRYNYNNNPRIIFTSDQFYQKKR